MEKKLFGLITLVFTVALFITACSKDKGQVYNKGKEGQWVYSQQKGSSMGDQRRATSYSKRPYEGKDTGGEAVSANVETKPALTPYLLGRLKYKVMIADFQDDTKKSRQSFNTVVVEQLSKQLDETGAVVVVEREQAKKILGNIKSGSAITSSSLVKLRTLLGIQGVIVGTIQDVMVGTGKKEKTEESVAITKIDVRLFDTETGNVLKFIKSENPLFASHTEGALSQDKAIQNAIDVTLRNVTDGILRALAGLEWSTSVASIDGDKVYLNAGKLSGLKVDDVLEVYSLGREIRHPITGLSLGRLPGQLKGTIKVDQFLGVDAAEAKMMSGREIATGDLVKIAKQPGH